MTFSHIPTSQSCHCEEWNDEAISVLVIRIRHKIYEIPGLGALLSEVMRRPCVVRSEGVPPACAQNRLTCKKANPYEVEIASGFALSNESLRILSRS